MDATLKEAIRIQESHQILPTKKKEDVKIHEVMENMEKMEDGSSKDPQAP